MEILINLILTTFRLFTSQKPLGLSIVTTDYPVRQAIMLTQRSLKAISTIIHHSCVLKIIPFDWNPKTFTLTVITDRRVIITFSLTVYLWLMCFYNLVSLYHFRKSMKVSKKVLHMVMSTVYILGLVFTYNTLKRKSEIARFTNHFFKFQKNMEGKSLVVIRLLICHTSVVDI